jgi:para-aminobenzoate synthetase
MAVRHETRPQWGVQFHPESFATENGARLLRRFLALARAFRLEPAERSRSRGVELGVAGGP